MIVFALLPIFVAAIPQGRGHLGIEAECLGKIRDGAVVIVFVVGKGAAALEERIRILGIEPDGFGKVGKRLVGVTFAAPHDGALAVGGGKIRSDPNGLAVIGECMIQIALEHVFEAAIVDCRGKFGVDTECLGKVGDGAVVIALLVAIDAAALEERIGGARVEDDGLIEVGKGARNVVPVVRPDHGAPENRLGKIRIKADRFIEVRDGAVNVALAPQRKAAMVQQDRQFVSLDLSGLDPTGAGGDRVLAGLLGAIGRFIDRGEPGNHHKDCKGQRGDGEPPKPHRIHPGTPSRQQYRQTPSIAINRTTPGAVRYQKRRFSESRTCGRTWAPSGGFRPSSAAFWLNWSHAGASWRMGGAYLLKPLRSILPRRKA
jgi:hypothetical protein